MFIYFPNNLSKYLFKSCSFVRSFSQLTKLRGICLLSLTSLLPAVRLFILLRVLTNTTDSRDRQRQTYNEKDKDRQKEGDTKIKRERDKDRKRDTKMDRGRWCPKLIIKTSKQELIQCGSLACRKSTVVLFRFISLKFFFKIFYFFLLPSWNGIDPKTDLN